jgi:hypothetical protein
MEYRAYSLDKVSVTWLSGKAVIFCHGRTIWHGDVKKSVTDRW